MSRGVPVQTVPAFVCKIKAKFLVRADSTKTGWCASAAPCTGLASSWPSFCVRVWKRARNYINTRLLFFLVLLVLVHLVDRASAPPACLINLSSWLRTKGTNQFFPSDGIHPTISEKGGIESSIISEFSKLWRGWWRWWWGRVEWMAHVEMQVTCTRILHMSTSISSAASSHYLNIKDSTCLVI